MAPSQPPSEQPILGSIASSTGSAYIGDNLDIVWEWNSLKDINNKKAVICDFCLKTTMGGITRAKRHQMGMKGDVGVCQKNLT
ncbi:hypothetical protein GYH30_018264 [Glycine max]|uniref:BED-type domain-containing protein n=1 Tax=Glycine max TaxID=3847 RepID=K7L1G1_SOYBN|nr:hypothetical protein GYH30_018264 [Glycine max]